MGLKGVECRLRNSDGGGGGGAKWPEAEAAAAAALEAAASAIEEKSDASTITRKVLFLGASYVRSSANLTS